MRRKKNGFLTFIFSLLPGAAEMYMGFMKQGLSLMGMFFLLIFLAAYLNIGQMLVLMPLLWFYGFFHAHNLRGMRDEEFYALEDDYLFKLDQILPGKSIRNKTYRYFLAVFLIIIGGSMLLDNIGYMLRWIFPQYIVSGFNKFVWMLPQIVVAGCFIAGGIWLIRGKKQELYIEKQKEAGTEVLEEEIRNAGKTEWISQADEGQQESISGAVNKEKEILENTQEEGGIS